MSRVRVDMNPKGVRALLRSPDLVADLRRRADRVARAAGPGHVAEVDIEGTRVSAVVIAATVEANLREQRERNLTRAIDAAR